MSVVRSLDPARLQHPIMARPRVAESRADFIYNMGVVLKELNETAIWLKVIERSELLPRELLVDIIQENVALCKIFTSSLKTARGNSVM